MARASRQTEFEFRTWGGARDGAGRKPGPGGPGVPHRTRPTLVRRFPVHVTMRAAGSLPPLRGGRARDVLRGAFAVSCDSGAFRLCHFSIQNTHLHLVCEAQDARSLSRGVQGLAVRIARRLNRALRRHGSVWADRYHARILRTPREVRHALAYVLNNARHHRALPGGGLLPRECLDLLSSAPYFDGWRERLRWI